MNIKGIFKPGAYGLQAGMCLVSCNHFYVAMYVYARVCVGACVCVCVCVCVCPPPRP